MTDKDYLVVVQCHIVKERCSGYFCEKAFHERTGGLAPYPQGKPARMLAITCGGCCGRAVHRKLTHLLRQIAKREGIETDRVAIQLASCITKDNYHGPPCPHLDYLKEVIGRHGVEIGQDTVISKKSEQRRAEGLYDSPA